MLFSDIKNILTDAKIVGKLPKKKILESLELVHMIKTNEQFKDNKIIDLRIYNHIIVSNE